MSGPGHTSYKREDLADVREAGIEALMEARYREVAPFPDIPLKISWDVYTSVEASGHLRLFTARIEEELVGFAVYLVNHNPHCENSLQALQDALFVVPEHRLGPVALQLLSYADAQLAEEGVQVVYQHSKVAYPTDALFEQLGYGAIETVWAKRLDQSGGACATSPKPATQSRCSGRAPIRRQHH